MNRMEISEVRTVVEWDEVSGEVTVGCGLESRWEVVSDLREAMGRVAGGWEDLALVERRATRDGGVSSCFEGLRGAEAVLVWRARFANPSDSGLVARVVRMAFRDARELG